jgi:hypothetical protein
VWLPKYQAPAVDGSVLAATVLKRLSKDASNLEQIIAEWVAGTTGCTITGGLGDALKNGEILCKLINALIPGSIPKPHIGTRMVFKQMENVGWFLEQISDRGAKLVSDSDLFMTVDLVEKSNMKQVLICLNAVMLKVKDKGLLIFRKTTSTGSLEGGSSTHGKTVNA